VARTGRTERHTASLDHGDYFAAGMELLAHEGVGALTIARLCTALGVTKGSFYHHFRGIEDYRTQLLAHWATERERQVVIAAQTVSDPYERIEMLRNVGLHLHHEAEVAIRAWSRTDADAGRVREKVDAARERVVADAYTEVGVAPDVAALLGRISVAVLIGAQHRGATTDREALAAMYRLLTEVTDRVYVATPKT
jgi:AcrR family transcriptional regulator